jgi:hypothetical protein
MECRRIVSAWYPFVLAIVGASTSAGEPRVDYFKNGDVGAFVATVPLAEDVDRATTIFSLQSTDDSIYLLYVESPQDLHDESVVLPRRERMLPPTDRERFGDLNREHQQLQRRKLEPANTMYANRGRLEGLKTLVAQEEAKGEAADTALIAQTRNMIEGVETELQDNKAEYERIDQKDLEVQKETWKINDSSREGLSEEAWQRPEDQARSDALGKEQFELMQARGPLQTRLNANHQQLKGLESLLAEEEAKGPDANASFVARTRETIKALQAAIREDEAKYQPLQKREAEIQQEYRRIRAGWGERLPRAAGEFPVKVYGRFQGAGNPTLTLLGRSSKELLSQPRPLASIRLHLPTTDGGNEALLADWARARARYFRHYVLESPFSSYYQFCLLRSVEKYGLSQRELPWTLRQTEFPGTRGMRPDRNPDLYSITTGALAIQESLQLDAMTGRRTLSGDRSVPLGLLDGPAIRSHPFEEMLEGRAPTISPIAALIPYDAYYCSFASISKEIEASDLLEQWGTSLLRTLTVSARDSDLPSKYQQQLCIGVSLLTRLFGDLVIGEIVLTGSDPFLKEGTDLTIIIQVKDRRIFDKQMKVYIEEALT